MAIDVCITYKEEALILFNIQLLDAYLSTASPMCQVERIFEGPPQVDTLSILRCYLKIK